MVLLISGLTRSTIYLDFKFENLDYKPLFEGDGMPGYSLQNQLRVQTASFAGLPVTDVVAVQSWPGSIDVELFIDPGLYTSEIFRVRAHRVSVVCPTIWRYEWYTWRYTWYTWWYEWYT